MQSKKKQTTFIFKRIHLIIFITHVNFHEFCMFHLLLLLLFWSDICRKLHGKTIYYPGIKMCTIWCFPIMCGLVVCFFACVCVPYIILISRVTFQQRRAKLDLNFGVRHIIEKRSQFSNYVNTICLENAFDVRVMLCYHF